MGIIKKLFAKENKKSDDELKAEVLKKATAHLNATTESDGSQTSNVQGEMPAYESNEKVKKKNIRAALLEIAERGEAGVLAISISDKTGVSQADTSTALAFLSKNNYVESISSPAGMKYFLTDTGRKFCISKEFNSDF